MLELQPSQVSETFTAWIEDAKTGKPLPVYKVEKNGNEVTCYVPSENQMRFRVKVKVDNSDKCLAFVMSIDGQSVHSKVFGKDPDYPYTSTATIARLDGGPGKHIPLRFGITQLSDDGTQDEDLCKELGVIKVHVEIKSALVHRPLGYHPKIKTLQNYDLEKIEPLKIHAAHYIIEPVDEPEWGYYDEIGTPKRIGTFIFRYMSQASLSLMNIIPRCVPEGLDVMKDDLSHCDSDTKERCEELKVIATHVQKLQEKEKVKSSGSFKASAKYLSRLVRRKSDESKRPPWKY